MAPDDGIRIRRLARMRALKEAADRFNKLAAEEKAKAEEDASRKRQRAKTLAEQWAVEVDSSYLAYQHAAQLCLEWARE